MRFSNPQDLARYDAAQAIFEAKSLVAQRECLTHWSLFAGSLTPVYEGIEWEEVINLYTYLRQLAFEWYTNYRLLVLEAKIEEMENSEAVRQ